MESEQPPLPSPRHWLCLVMNYHRELLTLGGHPGTRKRGSLPWNGGTGNKVWVEPAGTAGVAPLIFLCWKLWYFWQAESQGWEFLHFPEAVLAAGTPAPVYTRLPVIFIRKAGALLLPWVHITRTVGNTDWQDTGRWRAWEEAVREICLFDMPVVVETGKIFCCCSCELLQSPIPVFLWKLMKLQLGTAGEENRTAWVVAAK